MWNCTSEVRANARPTGMSKRLPHGGYHLSRARFEGTFLRFGLVLFAAIARLPDRQTQAVRASRAKKRLKDSRKRCSDSIFRLCCGARCDSNTNAKDKSGA